MLSLGLCAFAFVVAFAAGRRSLVAGLATVLGVGYVYGIVRANVLETGSHFIFDAAVIGLYCAQLSGRAPQALRVRTADLTFWIGLLMVYPLLLILAPLQDLMIELVGLRGNIFLLPFLLLGARLKGSEMYTLALWVAVFNLAAGALAVVQFFVGIEPFFPVSPVTDLLYRTTQDLADYTALRIPSFFRPRAKRSGGWSVRWGDSFSASSLASRALGNFARASARRSSSDGLSSMCGYIDGLVNRMSKMTALAPASRHSSSRPS